MSPSRFTFSTASLPLCPGFRLLSLLVLVLALPTTIQAQFRFVTNYGTIKITGYSGPGGEVTVPSSTNGLPVTTIGTNAFYYETTLTGIILPSSITSIEYSAFQHCHGLTSLTLPGNVRTIGANAFKWCTAMTSLVLPDSLMTIGTSAFYECTNLTSVFIPRSVSSIGQAAFSKCTGLMQLNVDVLNAYYCSVDGVLFNKSQTTLLDFPPGRTGAYTIPSSVTFIDAAFSYCSGLTNITIPNSVTNIGDWSFDSCSSLRHVMIPNSVTSLGYAAFGGCTGLTNLTIPDSVASIGDWAFSECTGLTSITMPRVTPSLGSYILSYCTSLRSVFFKGNYRSSSGGQTFYGDSNTTVYYLPGTTGWAGGFFDGCPTRLWNPEAQTSGSSFGVRTNRFGFNITGTANIPVVVEGCTNLGNENWTPLRACTLTNGLVYFSDPAWTNYPTRAYRIRSP